MRRIKVFIIDDSAVVRSILTERLSKHPRIEVVGSAIDPYVARDKIAWTDVDVITLDIEMPRMDGLTFLRYLMMSHPLPVVVVSSLVKEGNDASLEALSLGAVDLVRKPTSSLSIEDVIDELTEKILVAAQVDVGKLHRLYGKSDFEPGGKAGRGGTASTSIPANDSGPATRGDSAARGTRITGPIPIRQPSSPIVLSRIVTTRKLIAIGASTGGTVAIEEIVRNLPVDIPPVLAVIHMPERFTNLFAQRLNGICPPTIKEAQDGERALPGTVYIAPGNFHMTLRTVGTERIIRVSTGPRLFGQRPAVDVLFDSVAEYSGRNAIGILLTGMGRDGARGLLAMREAGAHTIAQDEKTSIVFGMPKEAIAMGAAVEILPLSGIAGRIKEILTQSTSVPP